MKAVSKRMTEELESLRENYAQELGKPFSHFFCPTLWVDEATELCRGHVVNDAFGFSSPARVLQRKDVDNFYGTMVENDVINLLRYRNKTLAQFLVDPSLQKAFRPELRVNGEICNFYLQTKIVGPNHTPLEVELDDGSRTALVIARPPVEVVKFENANMQLIVDRDFSMPAIAAMIKAAHLTLFKLFGYHYGLSPAAKFVGFDALGGFFRNYRHVAAKDRIPAVREYFYQFRNMVRPVADATKTTLRGTVDDRWFLACVGSSGRFFALGVVIRTKEDLHLVLTPAYDHADDIATYLNFLKEPPDSICGKFVRFSEAQTWQTSRDEPIRYPWPAAH